MKNLIFIVLLLSLCLMQNASYSQCYPLIEIDGNNIIADREHPRGVKLPIWLEAGQTIDIGQFVHSISVLEFNIVGSSLEMGSVKKITSFETVPASKTWKVESILMTSGAIPALGESTLTYTSAGTYYLTTPPCNMSVFIQVWGGGGGGGSSYYYYGAGGGGGGGYAQGTYDLEGNTTYTIIVGAGGTGSTNYDIAGVTGGTSSFVGTGVNISATGGGGGGSTGSGAAFGTAGTKGTGSGQININGSDGEVGTNTYGGAGGNGGNSPNSGAPRQTTANTVGFVATDYGGGGGGARAANNYSTFNGGAGNDGLVIIGFSQPTEIKFTTDQQSIIPVKPFPARYISGSTNSTSYTLLETLDPLTSGNNFTINSIKLEGSTNNASYPAYFYYVMNYSDGTSYTSAEYATSSTSYATLTTDEIPSQATFIGTITNIQLYSKGTSGLIATGRITVGGFETAAY